MSSLNKKTTKSKSSNKTVSRAPVQSESESEDDLHSSDELSEGMKGLAPITESFAVFLKAVCDKNLTGTLLAYTQALSERTSVPQQKMIDVWNEIVPDYLIKLGQAPKVSSPTVVSGKICAYFFPKAKKGCTCEVSVRSKSGLWCSKHLKQDEKKNDETKTSSPTAPVVECEYVPTKGNNPNVKCTNVVSSKSKSGKFCSRHMKTGEKTEKLVTKKESKDGGVIRLNPRYNKEFDVYVDSETNLVLDRDSKDIYAKLKDGKLIALDVADIELLDKNKYSYNKELFALKQKESEKSDDELEESDDEKTVAVDGDSEEDDE
jgi:hypothetical protein